MQYRAANWIYVGQTQGRGRMDRYYQHLSTVRATYAELFKCGAVEEQMGYGAAVRRVAGQAHNFNESSSRFAAVGIDAAEMPRYAATIGSAVESRCGAVV